MISFLPDCSNAAVIARYGESAVLYTAVDGEKRAECVFTVEGSRLDFLALNADRLSFLAQGLIRASLAYGAARNAYTAYAPAELAPEDFQALGFIKKDGSFYAEIPDILLNCNDNH